VVLQNTSACVPFLEGLEELEDEQPRTLLEVRGSPSEQTELHQLINV